MAALLSQRTAPTSSTAPPPPLLAAGRQQSITQHINKKRTSLSSSSAASGGGMTMKLKARSTRSSMLVLVAFALGAGLSYHTYSSLDDLQRDTHLLDVVGSSSSEAHGKDYDSIRRRSTGKKKQQQEQKKKKKKHKPKQQKKKKEIKKHIDDDFVDDDDNNSNSNNNKAAVVSATRREVTSTTTKEAENKQRVGGGDKNKKEKDSPAFPFELPSETVGASRKVAVFYNVYVGTDSVDYDRLTGIIDEQLGMVTASSAVKDGPVNLYYTTIGSPKLSDEKYVDSTKACGGKLKCQHLEHFTEGFEEVTLEYLRQFCDSHPDYTAVYMHPKGSFHSDIGDGTSQEAWRRNIMRAILNDKCLTPPDERCQVCTQFALPFGYMTMSGNMFTAKCSYVRKLLPPVEFQQQLTAFQRTEIKPRVQAGKFVMNALHSMKYAHGLERYGMEQWAASHPTVELCDLEDHPDRDYWRFAERRLGPWSMFPRYPIYGKGVKWFAGIPKWGQKAMRERDRFREIWYLPGLLLRYWFLYKELPPELNWVWDFYPDGQFWREKVRKYGIGAVDKVTEKWIPDDPADFQKYTLDMSG